MDILHPLAKLHWEQCACGTPRARSTDVRIFPQVAFLHGKLYIGAGVNEHILDKIYVTSNNFTSWALLDAPSNIDCFGLSTYHSQLVLVGGRDASTHQIMNKLWVSDDGTTWQSTLPPMPTKRYLSFVMSAGIPECLIVTSGMGDIHFFVDVVEVLVEKQWFSVEPLPIIPESMYSTFQSLHNGKIYYFVEKGFFGESSVVSCKLETLLGACTQSSVGAKSMWEQTKLSSQKFCPISFGEELVAYERRSWPCHKIYAFSASTQSWVYVEDMPARFSTMASVVVSTGELVVIGWYLTPTLAGRAELYKGLLKSECMHNKVHCKFMWVQKVSCHHSEQIQI